jgi:hypothetical protein
VGTAIAIGFGLAWVALFAVNAMLPPFRFPEDDDSLRDYGPAAVAYATWVVSSVVGTVLAWRWVRRRRR